MPYTLLPNGSVLVNSTFADGTSGVRNIGFGGNSLLSTKSSGLGVSVENQKHGLPRIDHRTDGQPL